MEKKMESQKIQWNKVLNYLLICTGFILACLFIGLCFVVPVATIKTKAWTKQDIIGSEFGIHFTSAKTRIRTASNYSKVRLSDKNYNRFYTYTYDYEDVNSTPLYYSTNIYSPLNNYSSDIGGNVYLTSSDANQVLFDEVTETRSYEYIPHGATHFNNNGNIEEIFYDEIDNGDFVLLNNYTNHNNSNSFNVENLYLSFGTPYVDDKEENRTTPLYFLDVTATLTNLDNTTHNLHLNKFDPKDYTNVQDGKLKKITDWRSGNIF